MYGSPPQTYDQEHSSILEIVSRRYLRKQSDVPPGTLLPHDSRLAGAMIDLCLSEPLTPSDIFESRIVSSPPATTHKGEISKDVRSSLLLTIPGSTIGRVWRRPLRPPSPTERKTTRRQVVAAKKRWPTRRADNALNNHFHAGSSDRIPPSLIT